MLRNCVLFAVVGCVLGVPVAQYQVQEENIPPHLLRQYIGQGQAQHAPRPVPQAAPARLPYNVQSEEQYQPRPQYQPQHQAQPQPQYRPQQPQQQRDPEDFDVSRKPTDIVVKFPTPKPQLQQEAQHAPQHAQQHVPQYVPQQHQQHQQQLQQRPQPNQQQYYRYE
ncbi:unnamed protein product [Leptosia nina]|uniref:Activating signal cointegrator 1 complex subunit 2 homolog n=1 Tax=Leptosia nina TaxID=320188 RepID=A0AAV1JZ66_9NEOP